VAKVCRIYTDSPEDFEDYYQECVVQLWRSYESFRGASKISTWVYRVCLNVCLTQLRSKKRIITFPQENLPEIKIEFDHVLEERMEMLYKAIKLLKESDRAIILLYLDDKSYKDMAEILGITVTNVGAKVNRVKSQLKSIINGRKRY
jgi:RNA polymerase sigma-70 factor (ECF subfamily)